ncbi:hypothetical protein YSY43_04540 [Paenibacillus sp. YSY-4.3]
MPMKEKYLLKDSSPFTMTPGKEATVSLALSQSDPQSIRPFDISFYVAVKKGKKVYKQHIRIKLSGSPDEPQLSQISSRQMQWTKRTKRRERRGCSVPVGVKLFVSVQKGAQRQCQCYLIKNL